MKWYVNFLMLCSSFPILGSTPPGSTRPVTPPRQTYAPLSPVSSVMLTMAAAALAQESLQKRVKEKNARPALDTSVLNVDRKLQYLAGKRRR